MQGGPVPRGLSMSPICPCDVGPSTPLTSWGHRGPRSYTAQAWGTSGSRRQSTAPWMGSDSSWAQPPPGAGGGRGHGAGALKWSFPQSRCGLHSTRRVAISQGFPVRRATLAAPSRVLLEAKLGAGECQHSTWHLAPAGAPSKLRGSVPVATLLSSQTNIASPSPQPR